jgi:hypothetical protein
MVSVTTGLQPGAVEEIFSNRYTDGKTLGLGFGGLYSITGSSGWGPAIAAVDLPNGARNLKLVCQSIRSHSPAIAGCVADVTSLLVAGVSYVGVFYCQTKRESRRACSA